MASKRRRRRGSCRSRVSASLLRVYEHQDPRCDLLHDVTGDPIRMPSSAGSPVEVFTWSASTTPWSFPAIFVEQQRARKDGARTPRPLHSLSGPAAARVIRGLSQTDETDADSSRQCVVSEPPLSSGPPRRRRGGVRGELGAYWSQRASSPTLAVHATTAARNRLARSWVCWAPEASLSRRFGSSQMRGTTIISKASTSIPWSANVPSGDVCPSSCRPPRHAITSALRRRRAQRASSSFSSTEATHGSHTSAAGSGVVDP